MPLSTGVFPGEMKLTLITPLLKKTGHDLDQLSSYRPVSLLSFVSKLLEQVVAKQLASRDEENDCEDYKTKKLEGEKQRGVNKLKGKGLKHKTISKYHPGYKNYLCKAVPISNQPGELSPTLCQERPYLVCYSGKPEKLSW